MKVLIIEDEIPAAEKLERYISKYDDSIHVVGIINSIKESVHFLTKHLSTLDLIFMDIQLIDGLSFEIFDKVQVNKPVIFTTAFNEYAIDAFKVNSIAYLLKPITFTDLSTAMKKLDSMKAQFSSVEHTSLMVEKLTRKNYKERFMVKVGDHIKSIKTEDIEVFFAEGRDAYFVTNAKRKFIIDFKMEELQEMLNSNTFFRVNRTFIVNINAIKDVLVYPNSRLKITPTVDFDKEIIVSREKVAAFKEWFSGD